jgi:DNA-binding CsgD family transcriptional regulator/PAS domain-containing protein
MRGAPSALEAVAALHEHPAALIPALHHVQQAFSARGASYLEFDASGRILGLSAAGHAEADQAAYRAHYFGVDPQIAIVRSGRVGAPLLTSEWFEASFMQRDEYFTDYARPRGIDEVLAVKGITQPGRIGMLSIQRSSVHDEPFSDAEKATLVQLQRAFARADAARRSADELAGSMRRLQACFDAIAQPAWLVSQDGIVLEANLAARPTGPVPAFPTDRSGSRPPGSVPREAWRDALSLACAPRPQASTWFVDEGMLVVHPVAATQRGSQAMALVVLHPKRDAVRQEDLFCRAHGLTAGERRVFALLRDESTPRECAVALGLSEATVRIHIRNILRKTDCTRQAELLARAARFGLLGVR